MADHTIDPDEQGAYELAVTPGASVTVEVKPGHRGFAGGSVQVFVHSGAAPVYVQAGTTVTPRDPHALLVPPMTFADLPLGLQAGGVFAIASDADAVVSVARS